MYYTIKVDFKNGESSLFTAVQNFDFIEDCRACSKDLVFKDFETPYRFHMFDIKQILIKPQV